MQKYQVTTEEAGKEYDLGTYEANSKDEVIQLVLAKYPNFSDWTYREQLIAIQEVEEDNDNSN